MASWFAGMPAIMQDGNAARLQSRITAITQNPFDAMFQFRIKTLQYCRNPTGRCCRIAASREHRLDAHPHNRNDEQRHCNKFVILYVNSAQ
jgi:hypothetical protein